MASEGLAVFLGNQEKAFGILVDPMVGTPIAQFMQGTPKKRPLTHDLLVNVLQALGAKVERTIVNDPQSGTFFATLVRCVENALKEKNIVEIDARPSDCIAMATAQRAPLRGSDVWDAAEDMTEQLHKFQREGWFGQESGDAEDL